MKQGEMIALGLAGLAVYLIWQNQKPKTTSGTTAPKTSYTHEILGSDGTIFGNGWRYFDNGVAIDPSGNYYQGGQMVYQAPGAGA